MLQTRPSSEPCTVRLKASLMMRVERFPPKWGDAASNRHQANTPRLRRHPEQEQEELLAGNRRRVGSRRRLRLQPEARLHPHHRHPRTAAAQARAWHRRRRFRLQPGSLSQPPRRIGPAGTFFICASVARRATLMSAGQRCGAGAGRRRPFRLHCLMVSCGLASLKAPRCPQFF